MQAQAQCSTGTAGRLADRGEGLVIFADEKHFRVIFSDFGRISCDFRLDIGDFGKKCEIKGNKEKSRESGGSGQGKQSWGVGRYATIKL